MLQNMVQDMKTVNIIITILFWMLTLKAAAFLVQGIFQQTKELYRLLNDPNTKLSKRLTSYLLKLILPYSKEQENIIGDLFEEFEQFTSKSTAYLWLCKQALKSVPPLLYKNLKSRLASYFRERIR